LNGDDRYRCIEAGTAAAAKRAAVQLERLNGERKLA